jgi:hypothetical protein
MLKLQLILGDLGFISFLVLFVNIGWALTAKSYLTLSQNFHSKEDQ